jgi:biotin carboxyl carrier protein
MTSRATPDLSVRVTPAPVTRQEGDEPIVVEAGLGELEILGHGRGRLLLSPATGRDEGASGDAAAQPVLIGRTTKADRAAEPLLEVIVDGWRFEFTAEAEWRAGLRERARRGAEAAGHGGPTEVRAIIPGRVVGVSVAAGDTVRLGQEMLVIEAMKMQNELRAPRAGIVEQLAVGAGSRVEVGDLLVVIR